MFDRFDGDHGRRRGASHHSESVSTGTLANSSQRMTR